MKRFFLFLIVAITTIISPHVVSAKRSIMELPPFERAVLLIKKFETLHRPCHWPAVGYGHIVQKGERFRRGVQLSEKQADALLRSDLCKMIALYNRFKPSDALLLGVLSYNIGPGAVQRSSVYKKLKSGDRNIFKSYTSHCHYKGRFHRQLHQRRILELQLLYVP